MFTKYFNFANEINTSSFYSEEKGYGFIDFNNIEAPTEAKKALLSGNWILRSSKKDNWEKAYIDTPKGIKIIEDRTVLVFKADVPEFGCYKITAKCKSDENGIEKLSIFSGRRNLICKNIKLLPDSESEISFFTYVSPYIPALTYIPDESKNIFVSILGKETILSSIKIEATNKNTIFIAGDSTLTDQNALFPYYPICSCAGWAQDLSMFVKDYAVCNYAHSGLTTNCFKDDGHYDILKNHIKAGDFVIFQFGHNDQKRRNLSAFGGYYENLEWYIKEIRKLGATPIICSPISRVPITDTLGTYSLLDSYANACKKVCVENDVFYIDLHTYTFNMWSKLSKEEVKDYFIPGDITHTNDYGALIIAQYVSSCLMNSSYFKEKIIVTKIENFGPDNDTKKYPVEPNSGSVFDINMPFMDIKNIEKYDQCKDAFKKGLMDPCVMNLHPESFLPRAQLLMIYLRAIRKNGTRPYLGSFTDIAYDEWDSSFVQTCINENLIDLDTVTKTSFRPDDNLTYGEFASFCIRGMEKDINSRNISITECYSKAIALKIIDADKSIDGFITRLDVYCGLARLIDLLDNKNLELPSDTEMHPVH